MSTLSITGRRTLCGEVVAPPDKSITHRALIFAALGRGPCRIFPLSSGADNRSTLAALRALGVRIDVDETKSEAIVYGVGGPSALVAPATPVDCGNSGTTMRLLAGVAAAMPGQLTLTGDPSLSSRPMSRLSPLVDMGARLVGVSRDGKIYPPITIGGGDLRGGEFRLPIASAQVKSALTLAALWAKGETIIHEPARSRDHTERMLEALGAPIYVTGDGAIHVAPIAEPWSVDAIEIAPDMSSAAFLLAAAVVTGSSGLSVVTAVNPTRTGFLDALRAFGAEIHEAPLPARGGEPMARVSVGAKRLTGATIAGDLTLRAIDEVPVLAALAAFADGRTEIRDAHELRVKESDRIRAMRDVLTAFGAHVEELPDGLIIDGSRSNLRPAAIDAGHDHRIGMSAAIVGLGLLGRTDVHHAEIIDVSYPGFGEVLTFLGAEVDLFG